MTILANTPDYLVEYDCGMLLIHRRSDERHMALTGKGIAGDFRDCLTTHAPEKVVETFTRIAGPNPTWHPPMFKPGVLAQMAEENETKT